MKIVTTIKKTTARLSFLKYLVGCAGKRGLAVVANCKSKLISRLHYEGKGNVDPFLLLHNILLSLLSMELLWAGVRQT